MRVRSMIAGLLASQGAVALVPLRSNGLEMTQRVRTQRRASATTMFMSPAGNLFLLADAADAVGSAVDVAKTVAETAPPVDDGGWFGGIVNLIELAIKSLHSTLGAGSYGVSIVIFTLLIKSLTFPLNMAQIETTTKMQALNPAIKRIQAKYANDPQQMNIMMAQLYQENELNPLAGCLPAFAQIPIFIALYRALLNLAKEDALEESFLWLPNLEGPTYGSQNADWLFKFSDWNGFNPPLGWHDTAAYLAMPVLLVLAQSVSAKLLQPTPQGEQSEQMQQTNEIIKYLPLLIGFFSLNVPSGLTIYWLVNNIFTTGSTLYIRSNVGAVTMGGQEFDGVVDVAPPKKKKKEAASFDDMLASKPAKAPLREVVVDAKVADDASVVQQPPLLVEVENAEDSGPLSKSAEKKQKKAAKTRRTKKSRR